MFELFGHIVAGLIVLSLFPPVYYLVKSTWELHIPRIKVKFSYNKRSFRFVCPNRKCKSFQIFWGFSDSNGEGYCNQSHYICPACARAFKVTVVR